MASYYEQLSLSPQATVTEIETAIDALYNQWRQGVTHPNHAVVDQANLNMRLLEKMRATLTDPAKRAAYDAGIGLDGIDGLADPAAVFGSMVPPKPEPKASAQPSGATPDSLWACPNCKTQNPEWTQYCLYCQTELVRQCPECGKMKSLVKTGVCGNCGLSFAAATERVSLKTEIDRLESEIALKEQEAAVMRDQIPNLPPSDREAYSQLVGFIMGVFAFIGLIFLVQSVREGEWVTGLGFFFGTVMVGFFLALVFLPMRSYDRRQSAKLASQAQELESQVKSRMAEITDLVQQKNDSIDRYKKLGTPSKAKMKGAA